MIRNEVKSRVYASRSAANAHAKRLHESGRQGIQLCRCAGGTLLTWRENTFTFEFADRKIKYDGSKRHHLTPTN